MAHTALLTKMPDNTDVEVGGRIKALRVRNGMTQQMLAELTGVTFQQVQKYENGKNRISAGRLKRIAEVLGVDVAHLYDGRPIEHGALDEAGVDTFLDDRSAWPIVNAWSSLPASVRRQLGELASAMAKEFGEDSMAPAAAPQRRRA